MAQILVAAKYSIQKKIGNGSFGDIYLGHNIQNGEKVAIKVENAESRTAQLPNEARIYQMLKGAVGIPHYRYHGIEGNFNVLVLDLLGPSLEDLYNFCCRQFSVKTILMLADQMIERLEYLHFNCLIHRDIKPENFLMGLGKECNKLFLIDFGLAKNYCDPQTHMHIDFRDKYDLIGTARYASINAHKGIEQSRRDDMESIGYLLIYFFRGFLPWQGVKAADKKQKYERIAELKMSTSLEMVCAKAPFEFALYLSHCRGLQFTEQPNYLYLRQVFRLLFRNIGFQFDNLFDWVQHEKESRANQQLQQQQKQAAAAIEKNKQHKANGHAIVSCVKASQNWQFYRSKID